MTENFSADIIEQKFKNPEEELQFLRAEVERHERAFAEKGESVNTDEIISQRLVEHKKREIADTLHENYALKDHETKAIVLDLTPELHDEKIAELIHILQEKGVLNTLMIVDALKDPHLADDFQRFLVQYIKAGFRTPDINAKNPVLKALKMTLFEVSLPETAKDESQKNKQLKEAISKMEQFYSGMLSVESNDTEGTGYFVLELTKANYSNEIIFYVTVPDTKVSLFEKQLQSIFLK